MKSDYRILIASLFLVIAITISSGIEQTTSWHSDEERADVEVSILEITIRDSTDSIVEGDHWKWSLDTGQYKASASTNTQLIVSQGSVTIGDTTYNEENLIPIKTIDSTIIVNGSMAILSLLPE